MWLVFWLDDPLTPGSEHMNWHSLQASLLLVAMPGAPSSFLFLVVRPGAPSSFLAPSTDAPMYQIPLFTRLPWRLEDEALQLAGIEQLFVEQTQEWRATGGVAAVKMGRRGELGGRCGYFRTCSALSTGRHL